MRAFRFLSTDLRAVAAKIKEADSILKAIPIREVVAEETSIYQARALLCQAYADLTGRTL